ncbi:MAG: alkaline phosphatase [Lentisphaeria bacterium]|nr:alkaline phosphatase [Lentisphaeria bacterium]
MKRSLFAALAASAFLALPTFQTAAQTEADQLKDLKPVKYVFLFIGDGMSLPQRMMAEEFSRSTTGKGLTINAMPVQGYSKTSSASNFITDSVASGTAIACGEKTNNGRIGMDAEGKKNLESVAELAKKNGRSVGILTSITINHATPASFYAHNVSRDNYYDIGLDLIKSGFDYFGGGGLQGNRNGDNDIYKLAEKEGYTVAYKDEVPKVDLKADKLFVRGHNGQLPYAIDKPADEWGLAEYTQQCIDFLMLKEKPFFVMVEGGNIDHHGHSNDAGASLRETMEMDRAVSVIMDFAKKHPNDTLLVVTGDHETGGLTLGFANTQYESSIYLLGNQKCSSDEFKNKVNQLADKILGPRRMGPPGRRQENQENQAPQEEKTIKFDDIKPLITENFGLIFDNQSSNGNNGAVQANLRSADRNARRKLNLVLSKSEQDRIEEAFNRQFPNGKRAGFGGGDAVANTVVAIFDNKSSVGWTSGAHTALPVDTSSYGVNASVFGGMYENSDIAKKLKAIISVPVK